MTRKTDEEVAKDLARHIDEANKIMRAVVTKRGLCVNVKVESDDFDSTSLRDIPHITVEVLRPIISKGAQDDDANE